MEDLVYKRLTLFLAVVAALLAGAINLVRRPDIHLLTILLCLGTLLCWMLQQTVHRAQLKLDVILQILFADHDHPIGRINDFIPDNSRVHLVGLAVPSAICLIMTALAIAAVLADLFVS